MTTVRLRLYVYASARIPALTGRGYNPWRKSGDSAAEVPKIIFTQRREARQDFLCVSLRAPRLCMRSYLKDRTA